MISKIAFCALCQKETAHSVTTQDGIITLACENTTQEKEHAIRMSATVTKEEVAMILADHKKAFEGQNSSQVEAKEEQNLAELFNE